MLVSANVRRDIVADALIQIALTHNLLRARLLGRGVSTLLRLVFEDRYIYTLQSVVLIYLTFYEERR